MIPLRDGSESPARRVLLFVLAVVSVIALAAGTVWLLAGRSNPQTPGQSQIDPAEVTVPETLPVSPGATASAEPTPSGEPSTPPDAAPRFTRAARLAFRLGGTLYVAAEDGSGPSPVARIAEGPYALSPDGLTLATVSDGELKLIDTQSGAVLAVGPAVAECPVWAPDSSRVMFTREDPGKHGDVTDVWSVRRDSTGATKVHQGGGVSVSPDGDVVAILSVPSAILGEDVSGVLFVSVKGSPFRTVRVPGGQVTAVAASTDALYVGVLSAAGEARIMRTDLRGGGRTEFHGAPGEDSRATWGVLRLSPDGTRLAGAATGDDEHSRVSIFALPGGAETRLNARRDGYLRCWSAKGDQLFFIEGNAYQGEPTTLYRVDGDGAGRRAIVTGAE